MSIKTKEFNTTEKEFRQIVVRQTLKTLKWVILIFVANGILNLITDLSSNHIPLWTFGWFLIAALLVSLPLFARIKRQNNLNLLSRYAETDGDFFIMYFQDGSLLKLRYELFTKVIKTNNYYFLYLGQGFHYLPLAAFHSENDINSFESLLKNKRLL